MANNPQENVPVLKWFISAIIISNIIGFAGMYTFVYFHDFSSNSSNLEAKGCTGVGNQSCIDKVRQNFNNTGKTILGEEYLDNGRFGISFLDAQYPSAAYNARIYTDCNCNITNVDVSTVK